MRMDLKMQWTAFGLMALALVVAVGVGMARNTGTDQMSVSMADYNAVNQERLGFAVTMTHFVGRTHEMSRRWSWQERRGHQIAVEHWMDQARGAAQEAMGWQVAADHFMSRAHGAGQEAMGWRNAADRAMARVAGLRQELMGMNYQIGRHTGRMG